MLKKIISKKTQYDCQQVLLILLKDKVICRNFYSIQHCTGYLCLMVGLLHKIEIKDNLEKCGQTLSIGVR